MTQLGSKEERGRSDEHKMQLIREPRNRMIENNSDRRGLAENYSDRKWTCGCAVMNCLTFDCRSEIKALGRRQKVDLLKA